MTKKKSTKKAPASLPEKPPKKASRKKRDAETGKLPPGPEPWEPTGAERAQVTLLASEEFPQVVIAALVHGGIDVKTLKDKFALELLGGSAQVITTAYSRLFADIRNPLARGGTRAAMYLAEKHGKRSHKAVRVGFGGGGAPGAAGEIGGDVFISMEIGEAKMRDDIVRDTDDSD